jgi:REP element-mobilizing transposase RayT
VGEAVSLADAKVFDAIKTAIPQLRRWNVLAAVIMPDHAHFIVGPREERGLSVGDFATGLKRLIRQSLGFQSWEWQRGCFDHLLRSDEKAEAWPYYFDFVNDPGKLATSPTEAQRI